MPSTIAVTLSLLLATGQLDLGQVEGVPAEPIPAPQAQAAPYGPPMNLQGQQNPFTAPGGNQLRHPHGAAISGGNPAPFAYPTAHPYPDVAPEGIFGPVRCGWAYPNGFCGHHCLSDPSSWANWWFTPENMLPHYHYFAAEHGYYYFEPYTVTRVGIQQSFVASFGGDPRHPYANEALFEQIYKDLKVPLGHNRPSEEQIEPEGGVDNPFQGDVDLGS